jgi:hypothetical protein
MRSKAGGRYLECVQENDHWQNELILVTALARQYHLNRILGTAFSNP